MPNPSSDTAPRRLLSSEGRGWSALAAELVHVPCGLARAPGGEWHRLGIHVGPPARDQEK